MMKHEIIQELDRTSATTGAKNFINRTKDSLLGNMGSGDAIGRQQSRLVADKLYRNWRIYLGQQGKQATADELNQYIFGQFGGNPSVMPALKQQFPTVFGQPQPNQPQQAGQPQQPPQPPEQPAQPAAPEISDQDSMGSFQNYQKRINNLLQQGMQSGKPDPTRIMRSVICASTVLGEIPITAAISLYDNSCRHRR